MVINTNVPALFAQNALYQTNNTLQQIEQEMSTGLQINSPADNPSGLSIANLMTGELGGINAALSNANQASNLLNVANGGIQTDIQIVQQIQQLATQASNSTNNAQNTQAIQDQINQLLQSLDNVSQNLSYNNEVVLGGAYGATAPTGSFSGGTTGIVGVVIGADSGAVPAGAYSVSVQYSSSNLSDTVTIYQGTTAIASGQITNINTDGTISLQLVAGGNAATATESFVVQVNQASIVANTSATANFSVTNGQTLQFQIGPNNATPDTMNVNLGNFSSAALGLQYIDVTTQGGAQYAIEQAQNALSILSNAQSYVGANLDQINTTISNLQTETTNLQASKSTIMDANMAQVTSQFAQEQILAQTGIQALQTAQQMPQLVLKLLG